MKHGKFRRGLLKLLCFCALWVLVLGCTAYAAGKPGKVKNFTGKAGENKVKLTWAKAENAQGYLIYAVNNKTSAKKVIQTVKGRSTTKATVKKLQNGKRYYFCIAAYSGSGKKRVVGKRSAVISAKPKIITPKAPKLHLTEVTKKSVTFKWDKVDYATAYNYTLYRVTSKKSVTVYKGTVKKPKKITLKKLKPGKKYKLVLTATRTVGKEKATSKKSKVSFVSQKDYLKKTMLKSIVQYSEYTTSNTHLVYSDTVAEAFANYGNDGRRFNSATNYLIWCNIYTRRFFLFKRSSGSDPWKLKFSTPCIVGRPDCQTPRSTWMIRDKRDPAEGGRYACYLELYTYAIHSLIIGQSDWSSLRNGYMASAGCIRIMYDYAQYVYQNCGVGTTVVTR